MTYGEVFAVQPFANTLLTMTLTGAQVKTALEQQWTPQPDGSVRFLHLGISDGLTFSWSASAPVGSKVSDIRLEGAPVDPAASYRVTVNSFLADGGDLWGRLRELCDALAPLDVRWASCITFNVLREEAMLDRLSASGCRLVYVGLESFNPAALADMQKRQNVLGDVRRVVDACRSRGIASARARGWRDAPSPTPTPRRRRGAASVRSSPPRD